MSDRIEVGSTEDYQPGDREIVQVNGVSIGVFNVDGDFYAVLNNCPHQNGPLCEGEVTPEIVGEWQGLGERVEEQYSDRKVIHCPYHGWGFDVTTGEHIGDESIKVPTYDVVIENETVYIEP